ncbi:MAG: hypothetical protein EB084_22860 [Proteobacteria bacterium]|nr:hypothetical protein [Pseudomonadota bacterium]
MLNQMLDHARSTSGDARLQCLEEMSEVLARGKWTSDEATPVVEELVRMAATEHDTDTLEVLLNDLVSAFDCGIPLSVSLSPLVPLLDRVEDENLIDYVLHLLGQSRQMQFFPAIDRFTSDPREAVRASAESAMSELMGQTDD